MEYYDSLVVNIEPNQNTPTFTQMGPYLSGATIPALPTTSNNSITGTWSPAINNTTTTTYTFTPSAGQCGTTTAMTITINQPLQYTLTANDSTVCAGTTVTFSVNLVGAYRAGTFHCNGTPTAVITANISSQCGCPSSVYWIIIHPTLGVLATSPLIQGTSYTFNNLPGISGTQVYTIQVSNSLSFIS